MVLSNQEPPQIHIVSADEADAHLVINFSLSSPLTTRLPLISVSPNSGLCFLSSSLLEGGGGGRLSRFIWRNGTPCLRLACWFCCTPARRGFVCRLLCWKKAPCFLHLIGLTGAPRGHLITTYQTEGPGGAALFAGKSPRRALYR